MWDLLTTIIGGVYYSKGDNDKALEYMMKALDIQLKSLGSEHLNTKETQRNMTFVKVRCEAVVETVGAQEREQVYKYDAFFNLHKS
jgi:hypothetical protein